MTQKRRNAQVILGLPYDVGIDMWSFGCILAELYTGYPLFPGENEVEQLACIMEVLGVPPKNILDQSTRKKMFFDSNSNPRIVPNSRGKKRHPKSKDLMTAVKCSDPLFIDFLQCCLRWDPKQRYKPEDALQHEWILEATNPAPRRSPLTLLTTATKGDLQRSKRKPAAKPGSSGGSKSARDPTQKSGKTPRVVGDANALFPPINLEGGGPRRKKFHVLPPAGQHQTSGKGMITLDGTLRKVGHVRHTGLRFLLPVARLTRVPRDLQVVPKQHGRWGGAR